MQNTSLRTLLIKISFSISICVILVGSILVFAFDLGYFGAISVGLGSIILFFLTYIIIWYFLETFLYSRIRVIYKTINSLKKGKRSTKLDKSKNILDQVQSEVVEWAKEGTKEVKDLQEQERYRREYVGNVSHELKTPIFNLKGYIHTLIDGGIHDPSINLDYLYKAAKNLDRLTAIVEDLNLIAILESDTNFLNKQQLDLRELSSEVLDSFEGMADANDIELRMGGEISGTILVEADMHYIRQVLVNLVSNAIKYGKTDGEGYCKIEFFEMGDRVLVEVSDNGIGIEADDLNRVFERFYRIDKSRSRDKGGTGLGLAIVKHIIEAHDETINIRSKPGLGTTFAFTMKLSKK